MLAYEYWQRRFDRNPDIVGTSLTLNGVPHDIVGVMPAGFRFYLDTDVWSPYQLGADYAGGRGRHNFLLVGRLTSGRTLEQVQAEADAVSAALELAYPDTNEDKGLTLTSLQEALDLAITRQPIRSIEDDLEDVVEAEPEKALA